MDIIDTVTEPCRSTSASTDKSKPDAMKTFYESVSNKLERAFNQRQPILEVRFSDLSVTCNVTTIQSQQETGIPELPTIWNTLKHAVQRAVSPKKTEEIQILKGISGVLRPGTMTLVLGQPGSGKSTFLKALGGRLSQDVSVLGDITYNGQPQHLLSSRLPQLTAYVPQQDQHFPLLSVKETLAFAHGFSAGDVGDRALTRRVEALLGREADDERKEALYSALAMLETYPDVIKAQLGLQDCWDTFLGDEMVRGVSGGEKKRVTMGEMTLALQQVLLIDEISTGLDSAATFDIIQIQRTIARTLKKTTVISLLQPPLEVFARFDHVVLLNEGEVMYYGPRVRIQSYFTDLELHCPPNRDVADFLLDLGTPQQQEYETHGFAVPRLAVDPSEDIKTLPVFQRSMWTNILAIVKRQYKLLMRDTNTLGSRAILVLVVACVCSTNFINVDVTNAPVTLGVLFMAPMFPLFEQSSQLSMFIEMREIFYKQRSANFFQTSAYVLGNILSQVALAVPESFIYGALLYWIAGLEASASAFIVYELILLFTVLVAVLMLFFVAAISPSIYAANPLALGLLQVIQVFAGFIVTRGQIPDYLVWIYWIDPMAWSFRALAVNQYRSSTYDMCEYKGVNYCDQFGKTMGEYYLAVNDIPSDRKWVALGLAQSLENKILEDWAGSAKQISHDSNRLNSGLNHGLRETVAVHCTCYRKLQINLGN